MPWYSSYHQQTFSNTTTHLHRTTAINIHHGSNTVHRIITTIRRIIQWGGHYEPLWTSGLVNRHCIGSALRAQGHYEFFYDLHLQELWTVTSLTDVIINILTTVLYKLQQLNRYTTRQNIFLLHCCHSDLAAVGLRRCGTSYQLRWPTRIIQWQVSVQYQMEGPQKYDLHDPGGGSGDGSEPHCGTMFPRRLHGQLRTAFFGRRFRYEHSAFESWTMTLQDH